MPDATDTSPLVLLTDYAWPDIELEKSIFKQAGFRLHTLGSDALPAIEVAREAALHQPASILTCWAQVDRRTIAASRNLQHIGRIGIGLDNIDVQAATQHNIWVTNVPTYCLEEVSDHAVGFVLNWARGISAYDNEIHAGQWQPAQARLRRLSTLCCGIIGYGKIGQRTAYKLGNGFGCKILACDPFPQHGDYPVNFVSLDELLTSSDAVIIHAPLTAQTHHLIDHTALARMRRNALLVNVSRGGLVDTRALVQALKNNALSGVGLDVLEEEPNVPDELLRDRRVTLTPHIAFTSDVALEELRTSACEQAIRVLRGDRPLEACNAPAGRG